MYTYNFLLQYLELLLQKTRPRPHRQSGIQFLSYTHERLFLLVPVQVHSNNMFTRGVKIFSSVSCWFKPRLIAGWEAEAVTFKTVLDDRNPSARYVTVPLGRRAAKSLRCRFYFADVWMMFSEICFQSGSNTQANEGWRLRFQILQRSWFY